MCKRLLWWYLMVAGLALSSGAPVAAQTPLVLDNFEQYTDDESSRIFDAWVDGWNDDTNGSVVGHTDSPFAEQEIVHGGGQSLIFQYNNSVTAMLSETQRTFDQAIDVTEGGTLAALTMWYQGRRGAAGGVSYDSTAATYTVTGAGAEIGETRDEFQFACTQGSRIPRATRASCTIRTTNGPSWRRNGPSGRLPPASSQMPAWI